MISGKSYVKKRKIMIIEYTRVDVKNDFWEKLCEETEDYDNRIYVLGDFNARVGQRDGQSQNVVGAYGEAIKSNNGQRLIEYLELGKEMDRVKM
ncbi:hypothetical protein QE152_g13753 [Popillia japonica]|uniref:Craniofacial development protein 2-like n=1 Tax=Popillia japonica TaxID=7064 RepID=A0AAW1LC66_POPJA